MSEQPTPSSGRFARFVRGFWRLTLFGLLVAVITGLLYFGAPLVYRSFVSPIQNNRLAISQLQRTQGDLSEVVTGQLEGHRQRLTQLETGLAAERETRSELEAALAEQADLISAQATAQAELADRVEAQSQAIAALEQGLATVESNVSALEASLVEMAAPDVALSRAQGQIRLVQAQQAVLKTRLHLLENNAGQAQLALAQADNALADLRPLLPSGGRETLDDIQAQLGEVAAAIEERPFIAAQEVEILWELLQELAGMIEE
ncbi:MAG: hypothetical protein ACE5H9_17510 [Anaerolineae bacterium]